jgi:putative SOS response-associated peptidase YedK
MCGRFTVKMTWADIVALYRLTLDRPPHSLPPRYNVCPTDPIDVVTRRQARFRADALGSCRVGDPHRNSVIWQSVREPT